MKNENEMDELFRHGLQKDYPYDENLWAQVEAQLDSSYKGKGIWYTNLNSFILIATLIAFTFIQTDTVKTNATALNEQNEQADHTGKLIAFSDDGIISASDPDSQNEQNNVNRLVADNEAIQQQNFVAEKVDTNPIGIPNRKLDKQGSDKNATQSVINNPVVTAQKIPDLIVEVEDDKTSFNEGKAAIALSKIEKDKQELATLPDYLSMQALVPYSYRFDDPEYYKEPLYIEQDKLSKLQAKLKQKFYYAELMAMRSFDLEKNISDADPNLKAFKEENERSSHMESYGLEVFTDHKFLTFGIGIRLSSYVENVTYLVDVERNEYIASFDTSYILINEDFNNDGVPTTLIKEDIQTNYTPVTILAEERISLRNEFKRIQVPLSIGIEKSIGRWNAGLRAGLMVNYLFQQSGVYIDEDLNKIEGFNNGDRFNKLTFSQGNEIRLGYRLNEFMVLGAKYGYEYDLNSFTRDYDSRFQNQSLGLWLRWNIRRSYMP